MYVQAVEEHHDATSQPWYVGSTLHPDDVDCGNTALLRKMQEWLAV
jgi:hypothetical protein